MAEWSKATVLKAVVPLAGPGVRIPLPPLFLSLSAKEKAAVQQMWGVFLSCAVHPPQTKKIPRHSGKSLRVYSQRNGAARNASFQPCLLKTADPGANPQALPPNPQIEGLLHKYSTRPVLNRPHLPDRAAFHHIQQLRRQKVQNVSKISRNVSQGMEIPPARM